MNNKGQIIKLFSLLGVIVLINACSSRGMDISQQVPELHPDYDKTVAEDSPYFLAEGGDKNKIIPEQRERLARFQSNRPTRSIASTQMAPATSLVQLGEKIESSITPSQGGLLISEPNYSSRRR